MSATCVYHFVVVFYFDWVTCWNNACRRIKCSKKKLMRIWWNKGERWITAARVFFFFFFLAWKVKEIRKKKKRAIQICFFKAKIRKRFLLSFILKGWNEWKGFEWKSDRRSFAETRQKQFLVRLENVAVKFEFERSRYRKKGEIFYLFILFMFSLVKIHYQRNKNEYFSNRYL